MSDEAAPLEDLTALQRWFQTVVTHPAGAVAGAVAAAARGSGGALRAEELVRPARGRSGVERMQTYADAYYARLLECLGEFFPVFKRTVGDEAFAEFGFGYLQTHPSRSYTLNRLGLDFATYLDATRPDRDDDAEPGFADMLVDLAELEWAILEVFDGPGNEGGETMEADELAQIPVERWPDVRLVPAPCLRLRHFRHAIHDYYTFVRGARPGERLPEPEVGDQFIALHRRDYVVRRYSLSRTQFAVLMGLSAGHSLDDALRGALSTAAAADEDLATSLAAWFRLWTAEGFFQRVELD